MRASAISYFHSPPVIKINWINCNHNIFLPQALRYLSSSPVWGRYFSSSCRHESNCIEGSEEGEDCHQGEEEGIKEYFLYNLSIMNLLDQLYIYLSCIYYLYNSVLRIMLCDSFLQLQKYRSFNSTPYYN